MFDSKRCVCLSLNLTQREVDWASALSLDILATSSLHIYLSWSTVTVDLCLRGLKQAAILTPTSQFGRITRFIREIQIPNEGAGMPARAQGLAPNLGFEFWLSLCP